MKVKIVLVSMLCFALLGCVTVVNEPEPSVPPLPPLRFENRLPYGIRHIVDAPRFEAIIASEPVKFPTCLSVWTKNDLIVSELEFDISNADTSAICYGNILSLDVVERYMNYLDEWLFAESDSWDDNLATAIEKHSFVFVVRFERDGSFLEIDGKWPYNQYRFSRVEAKTPFYIKPQGWDVLAFRPTIRESVNRGRYVDLDPFYDPITRAYYPTYFVYKLFDRYDIIKNIPPPGPWSKIQ